MHQSVMPDIDQSTTIQEYSPSAPNPNPRVETLIVYVCERVHARARAFVCVPTEPWRNVLVQGPWHCR